MEFRALGEIEVEGPDGVVELGGPNQRRLLALLIAAGRGGVGVDVLADAMWPDADPANAHGRVQTVVSRLRRALGSDAVATSAEGYRFEVPREAVDVHRFDDLVVRARQAPRSTGLDLYDQALALWRGPAFGGTADLGPVQPEARRLDQLRVTATEDRFELLLELGHPVAVVADLQAMVRAEPLGERLRSQLMRALVWTGRKVEALEAYDDYRDLLGEELGLDPSPELRALHEQVLRDEVPPAVPTPTGAVLDGPVGRRIATGPSAHELEQQAWQRLWARDHDGSVAARQDAYVQLLRDGDRPGAARLAIWLGVNAAIRLKGSLAQGWFGRAERLLDGVPPGPSHGLLAALGALVAILHGELAVAIERATIAQHVGEATGDLDVQALGRVLEGWARVRTGEVTVGMALVDEAMVSAVAGELSPYLTGLVYCRTLCACLDLMDYERAVQWTDEIDRLREGGGPSDLPGDCKTHRAAVLLVAGDWEACEAEARVAAEQTAEFDMTHLALVEASMGHLLLQRGDLAGARERFDRAQRMGASPHPGLALLWLAEGDADRAAAELDGQIADLEDDPLVRVRLLPAVVEVALARGRLERARTAADDLADIAGRFATSALQAEAAQAAGRVLLAQGEARKAARTLRQAVRSWRDVGSDHRVATARLALAEALVALGRGREAAVEAGAAQDALERIGAAADAGRARALVASAG